MQPDWSDIWRLIERVQTDLAFADIVRNAAKRTLICRPADATRLRWKIDQAGLADVLSVVESSYSPEGQILVIDQQAIEVETSRIMKRPWW